MISVLSLFSGIGGLCHHGISTAGLSHKFQVRQFVEISPYAQSQLRDEQPQIPIHPDITTYFCHRGQFDIVCGGFPCSGTSNSGNRQGLDDPRSALWAEQFRIIDSNRPAIALIENPTGLLALRNGNYPQRPFPNRVYMRMGNYTRILPWLAA